MIHKRKTNKKALRPWRALREIKRENFATFARDQKEKFNIVAF
jgi:hypothetical protein